MTDLTPFSGTKPNKDTQSLEVFDINVQNWVDYTTELPDEINVFIDELDIEVSNITAQAEIATIQAGIATDSATAAETAQSLAQAAANYQGVWASISGSASTGISVYHDGLYWHLNVDLADITASEPSATNTDWSESVTSLFISSSTLGQLHATSLYF